MKLILLGAPGAGKGTQASIIKKRFNIQQISTGDMLRAAVQLDTKLGRDIKRVMDAGELVPDETIIRLVTGRIQESDCENGFLLDGFPRTIRQAEAIKNAGIDIDFVVEIEVPDSDIVQRMDGRLVHLASGRTYHTTFNPPKVPKKDDLTGEELTQRPDDQADTVKTRLKVYHEQTKPLVEYYISWGGSGDTHAPQYINIPGIGSVNSISDRIFEALAEKV
ncbi:MAG: adenylate kinase [Candidatus Nitrotoga sp.]|nr:adenylate kinase [Candidatus Nitrotoga sp.]MBP0117687.1 adenylate kinase [Candidatus Nitrotoga sp.]MBP0122822.1 adenylate kinase [Candidatus Nitrotoga sp.]MBP0125700.1 adenylate kinase [Candidatus Nitrotoga sp.]